MQEASSYEDLGSELSSLLEQLRHKLLDLTGRNKLLNFHHRTSNCLRAVDELPDQVFGRLIDGKKLYFEAVPAPTERELELYNAADGSVPRAGSTPQKLQRPSAAEWAQRLDIAVRYELPVDTGDVRAPKHDDNRIQTLLYPESLGSLLRKLQSDARTAIEESGVNMLYMAFGFLDWRDPVKQERSCLAPLVLVPVELAREGTKDGTFRHSMSWTGEDLQTNLSLQKKLFQEFHLDLPKLENEDTPEVYFDRVREMLRGQTGWGVRRFVTLTLLNFGKQLVYLDLDAERWVGSDGGAGLTDNPLVRRLMLGDEANESTGVGEEHPPDARRIDLELALVDRADSTQAAALMRALAGQSMVIQGPPGTGKSQTITNLIVAALADRKSVLFVSEKLAALEVVKRRLDEMGFGPYCLELHSHKTRKQALYDSLRERLAAKTPRSPAEFDRIWRDLACERDRLTDYVSQIREPVGALGWPASRVLFEAGSARRKVGSLARDLDISNDFDALRVDEANVGQARRELATLSEAARSLSCHPKDHPWNGVSSDRVMDFDVDDVVAAGAECGARLRVLDDALSALRRIIHGIDVPDDVICANATAFAKIIADIAAVDKDFLTATRLVTEACALLGLEFGDGIPAIDRLHASVQAAASAPFESLVSRCDYLCRSDIDEPLMALTSSVKSAREHCASLEKRFRLDKAATENLSADMARAAAAHLRNGGILGFLSTGWRQARRLVRDFSRGEVDGGRVGPDDLETYAVLYEIQKNLDADTALKSALGQHFAGLETDVEALVACRAWFLALQSRFGHLSPDDAQLGLALWKAHPAKIEFLAKLTSHPHWSAVEHVASFLSEHEVGELALRNSKTPWEPVLTDAFGLEFTNAVARAQSTIGWAGIEEAVRTVADALRASDEAEKAFIDATDLDLATWRISVQPRNVRDHLVRLQRALAAPGTLVEWLSFDRVAREVTTAGAKDVARHAAMGHAPFDRLVDIFDHILLDALARFVLETRSSVKKLGLKQHCRIRERFRALDERVMELRRDGIAHDLARRSVPRGRSGARARDFTDLELIKKEIGKKRRHLPIRKLVNRGGRALQALKPCFMMGPMSVAQFLPPGDLFFDLVIFDEASQVRPEDAIGAIARGRQVVVVGDGNQLPPTSFFQRMNIDDEEDDNTLADQAGDGFGVGAIAESILELAESRFPRSRLLWHYRSAHDSLIAFSNRFFYDDSLLIFPSPARADPRFGIGFQRIESGVFDKGRNRLEADKVAEAAVAFLRDHPNRSLGVVAMNVEQADLIRELVDERTRGEPALLNRAEDYEQQAEPFFIKNLENVQGDERDVIMISMTYGPATPNGRVMQRFGPINQQDGWRRLNVLFTRAKERMEVFSSMRATDILVSDAPSRGVRTLRDFLDYAETGRLDSQIGPRPPRPPNSDFEEAVLDGLRSLGYECDPQVGASGYYIDLAVRDPELPGRYLLGIECDGAAYHSTPSARDRDRLRQDILEDKLGWVIERVWSTDWFRNPDAELERLRQRIEGLRSLAKPKLASINEADSSESVNRLDLRLSCTETHSSPATDISLFDHLDLAEPQLTSSESARVKRTSPPSFKPSATSDQTKKLARIDVRLSPDNARRLLLELRETEIKTSFPNTDPARGFLRKSMLEELIRKRPTTTDEFRSKVRLDLRENTDAEQFRVYGEKVFSILEKIKT